jgi:hypothetical protein
LFQLKISENIIENFSEQYRLGLILADRQVSNGPINKDYFFDKKKYNFFSRFREVEKSTLFLVKMGFSLRNWLFQQSFVVFEYIYTSHQFKTRLLACPCP